MSDTTQNDTPATAPSTAAIDASCRWPLILFFGKGTGWLVLGTLLLLISSIKMHGPGFLGDTAWLGLGRVKPAATTALVYGFAMQFAFGILLWMLCRLGRNHLLNAPFLFLAGMVWNLGIVLGFLGILGGASTGHAYMEMPKIAWPFVFVTLGLIALWGLLTFHNRRERTLYVSQWFLVVALFWIVWVVSAASYLLIFDPVRGVMQAVVGAWYAHNLYHLWLTPLGLAVLYYFIPKILNRPLYSRQMAIFGFWTFAFFAPWGGLVRLAGGPLPGWMTSLGIAATVMMILPLGCAAWNLCMTARGGLKTARENIIFRFIFCGGVALFLGWLLNILTAFRTVNAVTLFTFVPMAIDQLMLLGFFGMIAFGAAYYIVPRVSGVNWPSEKLADIHFLCSVGGVSLYVAGLLLAGLVQGMRLNHPEVEFMRAIKSSFPMIGLSTLALLVFLAGQVAFWLNMQKLVCRLWCPLMKECCATVGLCRSGKLEVEP